MGYCEQDLASLLENMQTPFSEAQVQGGAGFGSSTPERVLPFLPKCVDTVKGTLDFELGDSRDSGGAWALLTLSEPFRDFPGWVWGWSKLSRKERWKKKPTQNPLGGHRDGGTAGHPSGIDLWGFVHLVLFPQRSQLLSLVPR